MILNFSGLPVLYKSSHISYVFLFFLLQVVKRGSLFPGLWSGISEFSSSRKLAKTILPDFSENRWVWGEVKTIVEKLVKTPTLVSRTCISDFHQQIVFLTFHGNSKGYIELKIIWRLIKRSKFLCFSWFFGKLMCLRETRNY